MKNYLLVFNADDFFEISHTDCRLISTSPVDNDFFAPRVRWVKILVSTVRKESSVNAINPAHANPFKALQTRTLLSSSMPYSPGMLMRLCEVRNARRNAIPHAFLEIHETSKNRFQRFRKVKEFSPENESFQKCAF